MTSNLTRDEAQARCGAYLRIASYEVDLDLTAPGGGEVTFGSVTVVRFDCATPGASTFIDLTAPAVREITLNGGPVGLDAFDGDRIALHGLAVSNVLRISAELRLLTQRRGAAPVHRPRRRARLHVLGPGDV